MTAQTASAPNGGAKSDNKAEDALSAARNARAAAIEAERKAMEALEPLGRKILRNRTNIISY